MSILQHIKNYFTAKDEGNKSEKALEVICPNCWVKKNGMANFIN